MQPPLQDLLNFLDYIEGELTAIKLKLGDEMKEKPMEYYIEKYHTHK